MQSPILLPKDFTLAARLATGGMGDVWLGTDRRTGDEVAIKVFRAREARDPELLASLRREVAAAARLDHPHIIEIVDWNVVSDDLRVADDVIAAGSPYIVMEYAGGGSLDAMRGLLDAGEIVGVLRHTLRALAHSHARGVVHRDIKPPNILFSRRDALSGMWKLGDFGIARFINADGDTSESMRTVQVVGTPPYMAPEQFTGVWHDFGPWTDIYAVGIVAWELIFGTVPFHGPSIVDFAAQHVREELPAVAPIVSVPDGIVAWIRRTLSKDPALRFRNAAEARSALDAVTGIADDTGHWVAAPAALGSRQVIGSHITVIAEQTSQSRDTQQNLVVATLHDAGSVTRADRTSRSAARSASAQADVPQPDRSALGEQPDSTDASRLTQSAARLVPRRGATPSALIALRSSASSTPPPPRNPMPADWRSCTTRLRRTSTATTSLIGFRPPRPVGRELERDALWAALRGVVATGRSSSVLLEGVAGAGKTHLAEWLGEVADEVLGCFVLYVQHDLRDDVGSALARALSRRLRCTGLDGDELGPHLAAALRPWGIDSPAELAAVEMLATSTGAMTLPDGTLLRCESARERHAALSRLLSRLSAERPAIIVLDDAQWAADLLGAIRHIVSGIEVAPPRVLFVATAQAETLGEHPLERALIEELIADGAMSRLTIGPLPHTDAMVLATDGLGLSPATASFLIEQTGGNAMAAVQAVAAWHDAGALVPGDQGLAVTASSAAAPCLASLWQARIDRALVGARETNHIALEALAALGVHVRQSEAHETWRRLGAGLDENVLERLVRASLLAESHGEYRFAHPAVRSAFELRMREAGRECVVHRACHDTLVARFGAVGRTRARLAQHSIACGNHEAAIDLLLADALELTRASDYGTAELRLDAAMATLRQINAADDDPRARVALALRADVLRLRWRFDEAEAACVAVLERCTDDQPARRARATLAKVARQRGRPEEAERIGTALFAEVARLGELDSMADAMLSLAIVARVQGRFEIAHERYLTAERLFEALGDALGGAHVRLGLAHLYRMHGDNARAESHYNDARRRFERLGNRHEAANSLSGAAEIARFDGRLEAALAGYREALALQRAVGARDVTITELNIALVEIARGEYNSARNRLRRVLDRMTAAGQSGYLPYARVSLLTTHAALGDLRAWEDEAQSTFAQLDASGLVDRDIAEQLETAARLWTRRQQHHHARAALDRASAQRLRLSQQV